MIRLLCDICGSDDINNRMYGVRGSKSSLILVMPGDDFPKITECEKHICYQCLRRLGWKPEPEDTKA